MGKDALDKDNTGSESRAPYLSVYWVIGLLVQRFNDSMIQWFNDSMNK